MGEVVPVYREQQSELDLFHFFFLLPMCYRYVLSVKPELKERFALDELPDGLQSRYNISLWSFIPVVKKEEWHNHLQMMKRWLIPSRAKESKIWYKMGNARAETIIEKTSFKQPFKTQRCIIPASWFYEWKHVDNEKLPYFFTTSTGQYFGFAGIYEINEHLSDGSWSPLVSVAIITTEPNAIVAPVHDRMPVILPPHKESVRLDEQRSEDELMDLLQPVDDTFLTSRRVSQRVNSTRNTGKELIEKIAW